MSEQPKTEATLYWHGGQCFACIGTTQPLDIFQLRQLQRQLQQRSEELGPITFHLAEVPERPDDQGLMVLPQRRLGQAEFAELIRQLFPDRTVKIDIETNVREGTMVTALLLREAFRRLDS